MGAFFIKNHSVFTIQLLPLFIKIEFFPLYPRWLLSSYKKPSSLLVHHFINLFKVDFKQNWKHEVPSTLN